MRVTALILVLIAAPSLWAPGARAQTTQDRYDAPMDGPPPAAGASLRGPKRAGPIPASYLTWTGKVDPLRGAQGEDASLRGPALLDTATGRAVRGANPARWQAPPQTALRPAVPTPNAAPPRDADSAPSARLAPPPRAQAKRLPSSLYDQGYIAPVAQAQAPAAAPPLAGAAPPQTQAQTRAEAQTQGQGQNQTASESRPHYYSLVRDYGLTPDPIPPAAPSVLALSPTVASAMAGDKDDGPPIDLAGEDQANAAPPAHQYSSSYSNPNAPASSGTTTTNSNGQTTTTYVVKP